VARVYGLWTNGTFVAQQQLSTQNSSQIYWEGGIN